MRVTKRLGCALAMLLASLPAIACSWGDPSRRLQDEIHAYYDADVVFLARIGKVSHEAPSGTNAFWMWTAPYEVLEVYRGVPAHDGVVTTEDTSRPGRANAAPHSCMGGGIGPQSAGGRVLVYADKADGRSATMVNKLDRFQTIGIDNCEGCEDMLARMRLYAKFESVTP